MNDYPENFSRNELIFSEKAEELGLKNVPKYQSIELNLIVLANWLQRLRDKLEEVYGYEIPITISSGYRCPTLNAEVGGTPTSYHLKGLAADINARGLSTFELAQFIEKHFIDYDQLIEEFGKWVHIGLSAIRRQTLQAKGNGAYKGLSFLQN